MTLKPADPPVSTQASAPAACRSLSFDSGQSAAVAHFKGPALVIAGPGSGKTAVITGRLQFLIRVRSVPAESILVITFSRNAAEEMRSRYLNLSGLTGSAVTFGTFHSVFYSVLREFNDDSTCGLKLIDRKTAVSFVRKAADSLRPGTGYTSDYYSGLLDHISASKNGLASDNSFVKELLPVYDRQIHELGFVDYDDMLSLTLELLKARKDVTAILRRRFRYIFIDEFQDINRVQFELVRLIAEPDNNVFAVGDDDQSIYAFRGSDPGIMLDFRQYYPKAAVYRLSLNYRSTAAVVNASSHLISHNRNRYEKKLSACNKGGRRPVTVPCLDDEEEAVKVSDLLEGLTDSADTGITDPISKSVLRTGSAKHEHREKVQTAAVLYRNHRCSVKVRAEYEKRRAAGRALPETDFLTFHSSKGLEYDIICIIGANSGITPHSGCSGSRLEEERRLFYVAATRAKKLLYIFFPAFREGNRQKPSPFIHELFF